MVVFCFRNINLCFVRSLESLFCPHFETEEHYQIVEVSNFQILFYLCNGDLVGKEQGH